MRLLVRIVLAALPATALLCSTGTGPLAGGSGSVTTNGVVAVVVRPDGSPAADALVRLRPAGYLADTGAAQGMHAGMVRETATDSAGRFSFDSLVSHQYLIEVNDNESTAVARECMVGGATVKTIDLDTLILSAYAALRGRVEAAGGYVRIYGLERIARIGPDGAFAFTDLPADTFDLRFTLPSLRACDLQGVAVLAADTTVVKPYDAWTFSKQLRLTTTQSGADVADDVFDFPLLVRLDESTFDFARAREGGEDLRFAKPDGTPLPLEIEFWDAAARRAAVWVLVDTVHGNDTTAVVMHWGSAGATSRSDGAHVFDTANGFAGVWHLAETAPGATGNGLLRDATANAFHGGDNVSAGQTAGAIGHAQRLSRASEDHIDLGPKRNYLSGATAATLEAWVHVSNPDPSGTILTHGVDDSVSPNLSYAFLRVNTDGSVMAGGRTSTRDSIPPHEVSTADLLTPDRWHHLAAVYRYDTGAISVYIDGILRASQPTPFADPRTTGETSHTSAAGKQEAISDDYFDGILDELRTQRAARGSSWIKLCYETQKPASTVVHVPSD